MPYVYSTATCSSIFCDYAPSNDPRIDARIIKKVEIKGGHGLATPFKNSNLHSVHTPKGVATFVSVEDLEFLKANDTFMEFHEAGFITWDAKEVKAEVRAEKMQDKDGSAPLTPKDFEAGENSDPEAPTLKRKK